jgi:hypothetical protein
MMASSSIHMTGIPYSRKHHGETAVHIPLREAATSELRIISTIDSVPVVRLLTLFTPPTAMATGLGGFAGLAAARYRHQCRWASANNRDASAASQR